jgi:acyl-CoA reductase-like NAD-dependent aldehyde dehydrogenase
LLASDWETLAEAVHRDVDKSRAETLATEILPLAAACRYLEQQARFLLRPHRVPGRQRPLWLWGQSDTVYRRPRGIVGIIGTWNFPLMLNGVQLVQALTAGNAVVWKPSEVAPASAAALAALLEKAGFPAGLVHTMPATREGGVELAGAEVDHIVFTGSEATGRVLAANLGKRLVSSTMELSGCDAMFVLDDADVSLAARAAWFGCTLNRGQTCVAVRRALVHEALYSSFVEILKPLAATAPPVKLALAGSIRQANRLVAAAVDNGAHLLANGAEVASDGENLCPVRVVVDAQPDMALCQEASFAPLLAVLPFSTPEQAVQMDEQCPFALGASIFTRSPAKAARLAAQVRAGMVTVNDVIVPMAHPAAAFGGRGASGWGSTQGPEGLLEMILPQTVSVRGGSYRPHYDTPGANAMMSETTLRGMLEWSHAANFRGRWRGFWRLIRGLRGKK